MPLLVKLLPLGTRALRLSTCSSTKFTLSKLALGTLGNWHSGRNVHTQPTGRIGYKDSLTQSSACQIVPTWTQKLEAKPRTAVR